MESEKEKRIKLARKVGREIMAETRRKMEAAVKGHPKEPDYLKMIQAIYEADEKYSERVGKVGKRIAENYRVRFEVLKRDGFKC